MNLIEYKGIRYPKFQSEGFAARWAFPFAQEICKGNGVDIGYGKPEWKLPGAFGIDQGKVCFKDTNEEDEVEGVGAENLINYDYDYIFSSHCLEHLPDWVGVLNYWFSRIKPGGILFLYLPHPNQEYWKPWNNRKHVNILHPADVEMYLWSRGDLNYWQVSGIDLNHSYYAIGQKRLV